MNRKTTNKLAILATAAISTVASAQVFPNGSSEISTTAGTTRFGDTGVTETKISDGTPANFVTLIPGVVPEVTSTGLAAGAALGLFALTRLLARKK